MNHTQELYEQIISLRSQHPDLVVVIYGPTATGKSGLSLRLADLFAMSSGGMKDPVINNLDSFSQENSFYSELRSEGQIEIISADSRQVYRHMDIGTDKISPADRDRIPHYGIDLIDPDGIYSAHRRQQDAKNWIADIQSRGNLPVIVGGTGLYIDTIYKNFTLPPEVPADRERRAELEQLEQSQPGYLRNMLNNVDPDTAAEFHPRNTRYLIRAIEIYEQTGIPKSILAQERPVDYPLLMVSLTRDVDTANTLIRQRVEEMIERGLVAEVQGLLDQGYAPDLQSMNGIGYRQTIEILNFKGEILNEKDTNLEFKIQNSKLLDSITLASTRYAKRQRTRFRRYEKDAHEHQKDRVMYMTIAMD